MKKGDIKTANEAAVATPVEETKLALREVVDALLPNSKIEYDVIVVGGGPAGIGAALSACESGAKTLLLEADSIFGGVATAALWMPVNRIMLNGVTPEGGKRGGVHDKFVDAIKRHGAEAYSERRHPVTDVRGGLSIHPEYLRLAVCELLESVGCHYGLYSPVIDVVKDGNVMRGVTVSGKSGTIDFNGKIVIDCSGDADVSYFAGVETLKGRESDGLFMPPSLLFAISNVDIDRFFDWYLDKQDDFRAYIQRMKDSGLVTLRWHEFIESSTPNTLTVNNGGVDGWGNIDATCANDLTRAERLGVQAAIDFVRYARSHKIPGLENCSLMRAGHRIAIRDTRRIAGEYMITHDDALNSTEFEDIVSRRYGFIDAVGYYVAQMKSGHAYPYRCLLPKNVENLLVAGRCASATHLGFASGRGMGENMGMGQAAGVAAAEALKQGVYVRNIDISPVQDTLRSRGVDI